MYPVFTSEQMRECDRISIEDFGIPGLILMENASRGAVDVMEKVFGSINNKSLLFFCGKGNNGGDGFAIARHCVNRGAIVQCMSLTSDDQLKDDAKTNLSILRKMMESNSFINITHADSMDIVQNAISAKPDIIVDALFGTGLTSGVTGFSADVITAIYSSRIPVLAVDIPSGVNGNNGDVSTVAIKATCTATMGAVKRGLLFGRGKEYSGSVHVIDITTPQNIFHQANTKTFVIEQSDAALGIPSRAFDVHKYKCGKVFILAGSRGFTGAAAMASEAALRSGAGMVYLGIPNSLNPILEEKVTEVITVPLPETEDASFSMQGFDAIMECINTSTVSVIGPGVSRNIETLDLMKKIITSATRPLVIDADALFAIANDPSILTKVKASIVLTPHIGEFSRIINKPSQEIEKDRIEIARSFAVENNLTLILKGAPTVTATSDGNVYINSTGNAGMASAGMGDVLCGIIGGLIAQGVSNEIAAYTSVYLHGAAGDLARDEFGMHSMSATDVLHELPTTIQYLFNKYSCT